MDNTYLALPNAITKPVETHGYDFGACNFTSPTAVVLSTCIVVEVACG